MRIIQGLRGVICPLVIGCSMVVLSALAGAEPTVQSELITREAGISPRLRLGAFAGHWNQRLSFFTVTGADPVIAEGQADNDLILGGRFVQLHGFAQVGDTNHESLNIIGFDEATGLFTLYAADNMSENASSAHGEFDPESRTFTLTGYVLDREGIEGYSYQVTYTFESIDRFDVRVLKILPTGSTVKLLEVENSRI